MTPELGFQTPLFGDVWIWGFGLDASPLHRDAPMLATTFLTWGKPAPSDAGRMSPCSICSLKVMEALLSCSQFPVLYVGRLEQDYKQICLILPSQSCGGNECWLLQTEPTVTGVASSAVGSWGSSWKYDFFRNYAVKVGSGAESWRVRQQCAGKRFCSPGRYLRSSRIQGWTPVSSMVESLDQGLIWSQIMAR